MRTILVESTIFSIVKLYSSVVTLHSVTREVKSPAQKTPLRREQAALTRARIIEGATAVFEARGYEGARIEDIASEAGVAVPTVYKVFANKRNLLKASVEKRPSGAGKRARWSGRPGFVSSSKNHRRGPAAPHRPQRTAYVRPRGATARSRALRGGERRRHRGPLARHQRGAPRPRKRTSASRLASKAKLRTTVGEAARTLWVLSVPELYVLQIHTGGLNPDDYERWLGDLLVAALLGD